MTTDRRTMLTVGVAALAVVPFLLGSGHEPRTQAENRKRIAGLSEIERARLADRFERFRNADPADRRTMTTLHETVTANAQLRSTMERYLAWLKTLTPWQREELREAVDADARLALVRRFRAEQVEEQVRRSPERQFWPSSRGDGPRISSGDLEAMLDVVATHALKSEEDRTALDGKTGRARSVTIVVRAWQLALTKRTGEQWWSQELVAALSDAVSSSELKRRLQSSNGFEREGRFDGRRYLFLMMMANTLEEDINDEIAGRKPSEQELREFFVGLSDEERDSLIGLPESRFEQSLTYRYLRDELGDLAGLKEELSRITRRRIPYGPSRQPGSQGPPGVRRPNGSGRPGGPGNSMRGPSGTQGPSGMRRPNGAGSTPRWPREHRTRPQRQASLPTLIARRRRPRRCEQSVNPIAVERTKRRSDPVGTPLPLITAVFAGDQAGLLPTWM